MILFTYTHALRVHCEQKIENKVLICCVNATVASLDVERILLPQIIAASGDTEHSVVATICRGILLNKMVRA